MKRTIAFLLLALSAAVSADPLPSLPTFAAVCTGKQSNGFAQEGTKWTPANFVPPKFTVRKIDQNSDWTRDTDDYSGCRAPVTDEDDNASYATGCYVIGSGASQMCLERFEDGKIAAIHCDTLTFVPDGNFIRVPNVKYFEPEQSNPHDLVVNVGTCVTVVE